VPVTRYFASSTASANQQPLLRKGSPILLQIPSSPTIHQPSTLEPNINSVVVTRSPFSHIGPPSTAETNNQPFETNSLAEITKPPSSVPLLPAHCDPDDNVFHITLRLYSIDDTPISVHSQRSHLSDYSKIGVIQPWSLVSLYTLPPECSQQDSYPLHNQRGFIANKLAPGQKWLYETHHIPSTRPDAGVLNIQCPASCDFPTVLAWWIVNLEFIVNKIYFEGWQYHPLNIEYWLGLRSTGSEVIVDDYFSRCGPRIEALQAAIIPTNFPFYGRLGDAFICAANAFLSELSNYQQEICQCRMDNIALSNCIVLSTAHCLPITSLHTAPIPRPPDYSDEDDTASYSPTLSTNATNDDSSYDTASTWSSDNGEISDEDDDASYDSCQWKHIDNMRMINEWRPPLSPSISSPLVPPVNFPPITTYMLPITRTYNRDHERLYYARLQSLQFYDHERSLVKDSPTFLMSRLEDPPTHLHNTKRNRSLLPATIYTGPRRRPHPPLLRTPATPPSPKPATPITPLAPASTSYQRATATVNALMRHLPIAKPLPCTRGYRPHRAPTGAFPSYTTITPPASPRQHHTKQHTGSLPILVHDTPVLPRIPPTMPSCIMMLLPPGCARIPTPRLPVSLHTSMTTHKPFTHPNSLSANARPLIISLALHCFFAMSLTLLLPSIYSLLHDTRVASYTHFPLPQPPLSSRCSCAQTPAHNLSVHVLPSTGIG